jgi:uncharacterized protein YndB with AHSA1/START domain
MSEDLVIDRAFDATPDRIWQALTAPDALEQWFWPFPMTADVDARPGGAYRLDIQGWNDCLDRLPGWLEGNR